MFHSARMPMLAVPTRKAVSAGLAVELFVDEADSLFAVLFHHHEGDVQLARSLSDRDDVDARLSERAEDARRHAWRAAHPLPHCGDDRHRALDCDLLDVVALQLGVKHPLERAFQTVGRIVRYDKADRVLAR